ncbi:nuclear receptor-binding factor 2-like [Babylonia areolata]|uniref:nuclear receptor-binding factor 2-like n=1 Tax=Babylonia areolata TaxID=304850 RepID=UPI003FD6015A
MDSPLNRAHQWARKADALTAAGKYEEAVACHNRAAENMLETMQSPVLYDDPSLVSCLRQQHEHHLRQVKVLQSKQLRRSSMEACRSRPVTMRTKGMQTQFVNRTGGRHENVLMNTQDIQESMRSVDTMLRFLNKRKEDPEIELPWDLAGDATEAASDVDVVAVKKPKDDKVIIEELHCLTGELQMHIKQLVQEIECLKAENQSLSQKLSQGHPEQDGQEDLMQDLLPMGSQFSVSSSFTLPPLGGLPPLPKLSSDSEDDFSDRM